MLVNVIMFADLLEVHTHDYPCSYSFFFLFFFFVVEGGGKLERELIVAGADPA